MTRRKKPFPFFLWHRRLGLMALILVVILSVTGIMLNHTEALRLDQKSIESDLILDWYDMNPKGSPVSYRQGTTWLSQWNQQLFLNGKEIYTHEQKLQGMVQLDNIIVIALETYVLLVDQNGEIIELMQAGTSTPIKHIGLSENRVALQDTEQATYLADAELTHWSQQPIASVEWSASINLSSGEVETLKKAFRGNGLNLEKFILDLHSGRIFSPRWGVYIMDASAVMMVLLGLSGWWIWWSRRLKMRSKKHFRKHHNLD